MYAKQGNFIRVWDINRDEYKRTKEKETGMNDNGLGGGGVWRRGNKKEEWEPRSWKNKFSHCFLCVVCRQRDGAMTAKEEAIEEEK